MLKNIKANTLLYVLILVNVALVMGVVVFNNSITITNNLNIGTNAEEVYRNIYDKGHIALQSVRKFNTNGDSFTDDISCPTNVTMSGSTSKVTGINTEMAYELGTIYCKGDYKGKEFRIYFNIDKTDYDSAYYDGDLVKLKFETTSGTPVLGTTNVAQGLPVTSTINATFKSRQKTRTNDGDEDSEYVSKRKTGEYANLQWTFNTGDKYIGKIVIKKRKRSSSKYWDNAKINFYDNSGNKFNSKDITGARDGTGPKWYKKTHDEIRWRGTVTVTDYIYYVYDISVSNATSSKVHKMELTTKTEGKTEKRKYLDLYEFEMYEVIGTVGGGSQQWIGKREFNDSDSTLISFDTQGTGGGDNIDDNMNSDDYKGSSTGSINYAFGYEDDDVLPRKTFWGNVPTGYNYYNIFWNNYKTEKFIDNNPYNSLGHSKKISEVGTGYIYLDTYNTDNTDTSKFDLKIIQFDKQAYKDLNTLLPLKSWEGKGIDNFVGYIQLSSTGNLSLAYYKTGNEFPFNFKDYDYSIFVTNKNPSGDISYILTAETESGTGIYINPINDSLSGTVEVMANHMLMGGEKNFIGENFVVVGAK